MRVVLLAGILLGVACGSPAVKSAGESCVSSAECGAGLLCDLSSHTCSMNGDVQNVDAAIDGFVHPLIDGSGGSGSNKPPIDATPIDAPGSGSGSAMDAAIDAM
jgi:hypothetical protein